MVGRVLEQPGVGRKFFYRAGAGIYLLRDVSKGERLSLASLKGGRFLQVATGLVFLFAALIQTAPKHHNIVLGIYQLPQKMADLGFHGWT